ncbi:unnamed protein product [Penicillium pancosmium]
MRLLKTNIPDTGKLKIEQFSDSRIPKYAILSHRWGQDEITLQEADSPNQEGQGYRKIKQFCELAKPMFEYVWIDTCCIDKTSSAELSEAINSMYYWYGKADVCWAYLNDVPSKEETELSGMPFNEGFSKSVWFTRGWTLQELIAPSKMKFFDKKWGLIGDREELQDVLYRRTRVPRGILSRKYGLLEDLSVAQKMSWAAGRVTERIEDQAYCLMGLFGINMPLLYGERENAFLRLQEEILRASDDLSLFAWRSEDGKGLLAPSPAAFIDSGDIIQNNWRNSQNSPPTVTSRGIYLEVYLKGVGPGTGLILLDCRRAKGEQKSIGLYVRDLFLSLDAFFTMKEFTRVGMGILPEVDLKRFNRFQYPMRRICVRSGRVMLLQPIFGVTDLDIYPDDTLALMHYNTEKDHEMEIKGKMNEKENMGNVWCLLTDAESERRLKTEKNPRILFESAEAQLDSLFKMLVSRGATLGPKGWTELMENAITDEHMPMIRAILESHSIVGKGSDVFGEEALEYAARLGSQSVANAMLDLDTFSSEISLCRAARMGRLFTTELLLRRGAAVDERNDIGSTPLIEAVMEGHQPIVETLLEWGAVVDAEDSMLWTALGWTNRKLSQKPCIANELGYLVINLGRGIKLGNPSPPAVPNHVDHRQLTDPLVPYRPSTNSQAHLRDWIQRITVPTTLK